MSAPAKTRVLYVCIGNSCRSQMAEGFAHKYGHDVMIAASAGLAPAIDVAQNTIRTMDEKDINVRDHFPKTIKQLGRVQIRSDGQHERLPLAGRHYRPHA